MEVITDQKIALLGRLRTRQNTFWKNRQRIEHERFVDATQPWITTREGSPIRTRSDA